MNAELIEIMNRLIACEVQIAKQEQKLRELEERLTRAEQEIRTLTGAVA